MRNYFSKWILGFLSLSALIFPSFIKAECLDSDFDLHRLKGLKLGYYIGSFDPIHLGHQQVIEEALQLGYVDYVLIYPVPGGDQFKNRTDPAIRQKMIASIYQEHPKVLLTDWTPKELQDKFAPFTTDIEVVGIVGSDVVMETLMGPDKELSEKYRGVFMRGLPLKEKHYENTVGALMALNANSFLVALRGDIDLSYLNGKIYDRSIRAFIQSKSSSSTEVRNTIQNQQPFEKFVSFPVQAIIKQEGLYGYTSSLDNTLRNELLKMEELDQTARLKLTNIKTLEEGLWKDIQKIDTQHGQRLKEIINQ
jgi:cytidyltransferase-like protein